MSNLAGYQVTFRRLSLLGGTWTWRATTPNGEVLVPFGFGFATREAAEVSALRRIQADAQTETMSGVELARRRRAGG